jgi:hypothetical protein
MHLFQLFKGWNMSEWHNVNKVLLIINVRIGRFLCEIMISLHGYEQDKNGELFVIKSNSQQMLKMTAIWINKRTETDDHGLSHFQRSQVGYEWPQRHPTSFFEVYFHFNWSWLHQGSKVFHRLKYKRMRSTHCCEIPRKLLVEILR